MFWKRIGRETNLGKVSRSSQASSVVARGEGLVGERRGEEGEEGGAPPSTRGLLAPPLNRRIRAEITLKQDVLTSDMEDRLYAELSGMLARTKRARHRGKMLAAAGGGLRNRKTTLAPERSPSAFGEPHCEVVPSDACSGGDFGGAVDIDVPGANDVLTNTQVRGRCVPEIRSPRMTPAHNHDSTCSPA